MPQPSASSRLRSLDVFRGITVASMILVNNPGRWDAIYPPLEHAEWHGWTFTDTIFPFFLWIIGVALTLSVARRTQRGEMPRQLLLHSLRRALILFAFGFFLAGFPYFHLDRIRIPGVLPRIAVCYFIAAAIFLYTRWRGQLAAIVFFLATYWILMFTYPVPGIGAGHFDKDANFARYIDSLVLTGHMWSQTKVWDPEGLVSTLPAIATVLFGILTGHLLRLARPRPVITVWILISGNCLALAGLLLSTWMPINKNLWTASFAVFMAGLAAICFGIWYWLLDGEGPWTARFRPWFRPAEIYGQNAIVIFVLSGLTGRLLGLIKLGGVPLQKLLYDTVFAPLASPLNASLLYACANVLIFFALAWWMDRKGWYIKF